MMKHNKVKALLSLSLGAILLATTSCQRTEDLLFEKSYGEVSMDLIESTDQILRSAPNGWETDYTTGSGDTFKLQFKFEEGRKVITYADFAPEPSVSSYTYNLSRSAVLSFDTYGLLHDLANPVILPNIYKGDLKGRGYQGDFEFEILSASADEVLLRGIKNRRDTTVLKPLTHLPDAHKGVQNLFNLNQILFPEISSLYRSIDVNGEPKADFVVAPLTSDLLSSTFYKNIAMVKQLDNSGNPVETRHELTPTDRGFTANPAIKIGGAEFAEFVQNESGDFVAANNDAVKFNFFSNKPLVPNKHGEFLKQKHYLSAIDGNHSALFVQNILSGYRANINNALAEVYVGYFDNTDEWRPMGFWNIGNTRNVIEVKPVLVEDNTWAIEGIFVNDYNKPFVEQPGNGFHEFAVYFTSYFDKDNKIYIEDISEKGDNSYLRIVSGKDSRYWYTVHL